MAERCLSGNNPELRRVFAARSAHEPVGALRTFSPSKRDVGADSSAQSMRETDHRR
jgi:hypothetical protein